MADTPISRLPIAGSAALTDTLVGDFGSPPQTKAILIGNLLSGSGGATSIGFTQVAANAQTRSLQSKNSDTVSIFDFMIAAQIADVLARTLLIDVTASIQAALDYAATRPGCYVTGRGACRISATLSISNDSVGLVGDGHAVIHDVGTFAAPFSLNWFGTAGGTMIQIAPIAGSSNQYLTGIKISLALIANGAGIGLLWQSVRWGAIDLYTEEFSNAALIMGVVSSLGEGTDNQFNDVSLMARQIFTTGAALRLTGTTTGNTSINTFRNIDVQFKNGNAIECFACDNNRFCSVRTFRVPGGSGVGVKLFGDAASQSNCANNNVFDYLVVGAAGVVSYGTDTSPYNFAAIDNAINVYDISNGSTTPVVGTGSTLYWTDGSNLYHNWLGYKVVCCDSLANGASARLAVTNESLRIRNAASDHIILDSPSGADVWGLNIDGATGNLRVSHLAGAGSVLLGAAVVSSGNLTAQAGNIIAATIGNGLKIAEGSNAKQGIAVLSAGSVVVGNTSITANSRIFIAGNADGGAPGWLRISARSAGTSFTITSSSATDTSSVAWIILDPA